MVSSDSDTSGNNSSPAFRNEGMGLDNEAGVGRWTGRAVFVTSSPSPAPQSPPGSTNDIASQARSGSAASPISITSSPSGSSSSSSPEPRREPTTPLPRPRAVPAYSSPISRTAYTPPRAFFPPSLARQMSTPAAPSAIHPFFNRTFGRSKSTPVPHTPPPPASQRPRMVANYSSTSESQASTANGADSTFGSQPKRIERPVERQGQISPSAASGSTKPSLALGKVDGSKAKGKGKARSVLTEVEIDELVMQVGKVDLTGKFRSDPVDRYTGAKRPQAGAAVRPLWGGPKVEDSLGGPGDTARAVPGAGGRAGALARYGRLSNEKPPVKAATGPKGFGKKKAEVPSTGPSTSTPAGAVPSRQAANPNGVYPKSAVFSARQSAVTAQALPAPTAKPKAKSVPDPTPNSAPINPDDYFSYREYTPAPEVVYTTNFAEANALLSRLEGRVLGLDLEWPQAGFYKPPGGGAKIPIGMTWNTATNKWVFGEGKTALVQVCDEKLIVLIHLKQGNNMALPQKVIDIMEDRNVYKCGVQVQGDGRKLKRDFPNAFPRGLHSLLELSKVARRADPVGTGPGSALIALTKLTEAYTGKPLLKESKVRKSNWLFDLNDKQVQYAANDVYAGLQVYLKLQRLADERGIQIDLDMCSNSFNADGSNRPSPTYNFPMAVPTATSSATQDISTCPDMRLAPGQFKFPPPRQQNVLNQFRLGATIKAIAHEAQIQPATAQGYICDALVVLADDTLNPEQMGRLVSEVKDIRVRRKFNKLLVRLRRGSGEVVSNSEAEVVELDSSEDEEEKLPANSTTDELEQRLGAVTLESPVGEMAKVVDHGWTAEELEAAALMSDSEVDQPIGRKV